MDGIIVWDNWPRSLESEGTVRYRSPGEREDTGMDPQDKRTFKDEQGETWTVTRDTGVRFGASEGGTLPKAGVRGLHFADSRGQNRFLPRGLDDLPDRKELKSMTEAQLRSLLGMATPA